MLETERETFARVMQMTFDTLNRPMPGPDALDMWWAMLSPYAMADVRRAVSTYLRASKFAPTPADILELLPKAADGHPDPNEAWAIGLTSRDEQATVCWTDEIALAMDSAKPVLAVGDEVGGRMAFLEAYKRLLGAARAAGRRPAWRMSYGEDPHRRIDAEKLAVQRDLLPRLSPQVTGLMGAPAKARELLAAAKAALEAPAEGETATERFERESREWNAKARQEWEQAQRRG